ncbi:transposable element Tcb2 transposase [Trichonephila clavipes]|nr:transposable element Tcb2 transposase [Trichonephila clavipes]
MAWIARHNDESIRKGYIRNGGKEVKLFTSALTAFQCNNRIFMTQRKHLNDCSRGRIIGRLKCGRNQLEVSEELGIAQSVISRLWQRFQDDGRIGLYTHRPVRCVPRTATHCRLRLFWSREHALWTPQQWSCVLFSDESRFSLQSDSRRTLIWRAPGSRYHQENTIERHRYGGARWLVSGEIILGSRTDLHVQSVTMTGHIYRDVVLEQHVHESRFSLSSDSHRILIWRERGSRNHPSNIIERDRYGDRGVLVWGGIMLGSRTDLHIFDAGSVNGTRYCNEILLPYVRLFRGAMGLQFLFMDDNAPCLRTVAAEQLLESRRLAARTLPPVTIRELRLALQDEWAAMPQQLIDTLILSMGRRCETCLAVRGDHIPY